MTVKDTNTAKEPETGLGDGVSPQLSPLHRPKPTNPGKTITNIRLDAGSSSFISGAGSLAVSLNDSSVLLGETGIEEDYFRYCYSHSQTRRREVGVGQFYYY